MGGRPRAGLRHTEGVGRHGARNTKRQQRPLLSRPARLADLRRNRQVQGVRPQHDDTQRPCPRAKGRRFYYRCRSRSRDGAGGCVHRKCHRADEVEPRVWNLISSLLKDPGRLKAGLEEMIEQERAGLRGDPDQEAKTWLEKLSEVDQERRGYLRLAAKGVLADEELDEALAELEETRETAERELRAIKRPSGDPGKARAR